MIEQVVDELEHEILEGRARWVADLNETFRDYSLEGHRFELFARGQTRGQGFMLSRFFAWTVLPNYKVSLYARVVKDSSNFQRGNLLGLVKVLKKEMEDRNVKWVWLVLLFEGDPPERISSLVQEYSEKEIGIGCVDVYSGAVVVSKNVLGSSLVKHLGLQHLVSKYERKDRKSAST
jgi:hypothetical protein